MPDNVSSPGVDALDWVVAALASYAAKFGMEAAASSRLIGNTFDGGRRENSPSVEARDLPLIKRGLEVGRHAVVIGLLPEIPDERALVDTMRQHRNQCVVARSALPPNAAFDLLLILVGPRGSEGKDAWRALALGVERDDRVARKLVWLRPDTPAADSESFEAFAMRTFLARPWATAAQFSVASLDAIAAIVDAGLVPRDTAGKWNRVAVDRKDDPDALVEGLVEVWSERSAI